MLGYRFTVVISHDIADQTVAASVKRYLETAFMNGEIVLSGSDLEPAWSLRALQGHMRGALLILSLLSRRSLRNARLYFEAGVGLCEGKSLILSCDGARAYDLKPPMCALPLLAIDEQGMRALVARIAETAGICAPDEPPGLDEMLQNVRSFLTLRESETGAIDLLSSSTPKAHRDPLDVTIHSWHRRVKEQLKMLAIKSLARAVRGPDMPTRDELRNLPIPDLFTLAERLNVPMPELERVAMLTFETEIPTESDPRWKKMNAFRLLEGIDEGLRRFEKGL